ncbi:virulence factor [Brevibacillus laterosporus]|uniref:virulence factor n=1 Tax=Brevibacillus laterosporus TaxID=1465 RepID=UPI002654EF91|nr:virulence factor [Brevibacillus laterosporus]MDN9010861.1 virulence factor [Brevibacillus laterosporus]MDO0941884.1 virulence factor [Brevibacillus laterosporus]
MKIRSIEPTPSPNTMKLTLDEQLPNGVQHNFTQKTKGQAPQYIQKLLAIEGVKGVFQVVDFIALERLSNAAWQPILAEAKEILGAEEMSSNDWAHNQEEAPAFGELQVYVQMFRDIPMQVKVIANGEETRTGLPERFAKMAMQAGVSSPNLITERQWVEQGARYGNAKEVGEEVAQELDAAYDEARLQALLQVALAQGGQQELPKPRPPQKVTIEMFTDPDWRKRYAVLERMEPTEEDLPLMKKALEDEKASIRRLAVVYLGMIGTEEVLPLLYLALRDASPSVRRTAGDTLSDLGNPKAIPAMIEALRDSNKLVRWRAARFLYEVGDESALPALHQAEEDREFEISLQIKLAIERIEGGEEASGTVWQQMTNRSRE